MDEFQSEKLERFSDSVNREVDQQVKSIIVKAQEQRKQELSDAQDKALEEAYSKIQKSVRDIEENYRRQYALKQQNMRTGVLKHREELKGKIFKEVEKKLVDFSESDKYEEYMLSLVCSEKTDKDAVIMISQKDLPLKEKLEEKSGLNVSLSDDIKLGGAAILDRARGIIIDKTLDTALDEQVKKFSSRYNFKKSVTTAER